MLPAVTSAHLQSDNRPNEGDDEENARRRNGLVKEGYAENYRTDRTNACPNGIGRANGQRVDSLGQKQHAHDKAYDEAGSPHIILNARLPLHLAETEGKGRLKKTGHDKNNPTHLSCYFLPMLVFGCKGNEKCRRDTLHLIRSCLRGIRATYPACHYAILLCYTARHVTQKTVWQALEKDKSRMLIQQDHASVKRDPDKRKQSRPRLPGTHHSLNLTKGGQQGRPQHAATRQHRNQRKRQTTNCDNGQERHNKRHPPAACRLDGAHGGLHGRSGIRQRHANTARGQAERNVFFIKKGIVRAFVSTQGREITFWLGAEGTPVVSMKSYVSGLPGYESVECIEDTVLYVLRHATLTSLFADDVNIANWGRRFAEKEMLRTEERLIPQLFTTAAERYRSLMANHPELLRRVPLEHLASYLGVTPVSLSRIRATLK